MSTKAQIEALIATRQTGTANTVAEEVTLWNALKGELYPPTLTEIQTGVGNTITTPLDATNIEYSIKFKKSGNFVDFYGTLENVSGGALDFSDFMEITNPLYQNINSGVTTFDIGFSNTNDIYILSIDNNIVRVYDGGGSDIPNAAVLNFNGRYSVND